LTEIFQKLFGSRKSKDDIKDVPTIPISEEDVESVAQLFVGSERQPTLPRMSVGFSQSVGRQRDHNEDALFTLTTNLASNQSFEPLGLYIVADGMGGHKHGEIASELAIRVIVAQIMQKIIISLVAPKPTPPEESIQEILQESIQEAHHTIVEDAPGSGTTLTAVLLWNEQMSIAHVGDSRAYSILANGKTQTLTRDHSLVMRMMELGQLSPEEAAVHPQRNVLYRALGQGEPFKPDINTLPLPKSGYLLLCSDGLWGLVPDDEMSRLIISSTSPQAACEALVDAANVAGGPDNITAILVHLPDRTD